MRQPACMTGLACGNHRGRRAASALGVGPRRIDPEPEGDADRGLSYCEQRDRTVDAAAHRHRGAAGVGRTADGAADRVRERVDGKRLAADRRRLEQRQARELAVEPGRIGADDPRAVDPQPDRRPLALTRGVSKELNHVARVASLDVERFVSGDTELSVASHAIPRGCQAPDV